MSAYVANLIMTYATPNSGNRIQYGSANIVYDIIFCTEFLLLTKQWQWVVPMGIII